MPLKSWSKILVESSSQYLVLKAQTVRAALDLCQYQKVDCVDFDLDMEHSTGFEVLLRLIPDHKRPKVAVVVLATACEILTYMRRRCMRGCQTCLVKQLTSGFLGFQMKPSKKLLFLLRQTLN